MAFDHNFPLEEMSRRRTVASGSARWSQSIHGKALEEKFNNETWDPNNADKSYQGPANLRQFLSSSNGGAESNRGNEKAVNNYRNTASEWFVKLALTGVRKSEFCLAVLSRRKKILTILFSVAYPAPQISGWVTARSSNKEV